MLQELEDYNWFPSTLRKYQLEFIGCLVNWFGFYKPIVPILNRLLIYAKPNKIIDLCSGSGEPAIYVQNFLSKNVEIMLTDKFPPKTTLPNYNLQSVDVLTINPEKKVVFTMYNAFHHFGNKQQQDILQKFYTNQSSILIVEILTPNLLCMLNVIFSSTIGQLLLTPFIKPFSFWRLFFTYVIPINIFTVMYDGIISVVKSKSQTQYQMLINTITTTNYCFEVLSIKQWHGKIICIKAHPTYAE
jgi:hypothetical protein